MTPGSATRGRYTHPGLRTLAPSPPLGLHANVTSPESPSLAPFSKLVPWLHRFPLTLHVSSELISLQVTFPIPKPSRSREQRADPLLCPPSPGTQSSAWCRQGLALTSNPQCPLAWLPCLGPFPPNTQDLRIGGQAGGQLPTSSDGGGGALTGAVLVPGMAADGFHQEAVIGHGCSAAVPKTEREARSAPPCPSRPRGRAARGHPGLPTLA